MGRIDDLLSRLRREPEAARETDAQDGAPVVEPEEEPEQTVETGGLRCDVSVVTNVGSVRDNNEDNFFLNDGRMNGEMKNSLAERESVTLSRRAVYAVFDGMGGESDGELAAHAASTVMLQMRRSISAADDSQVTDRVNDYIEAANDRVTELMAERSCSMGTTAAILCIEPDEAIPYNCGDSRIYYVHGGTIRQLSRDHTLAQKKLEQGVFTAEQARDSRENHMLTRFIGAGKSGNSLKVYEGERICPEDGDVFILCSDGLSDMCSDEEILGIVSRGGDAAQELVSAALANGGRDNVTVMTLSVYK